MVSILRKVGSILESVPLLGRGVVKAEQWLRKTRFPGSAQYWEENYQQGGTSGGGSYGRLADFKAEVINGFLRETDIDSIVELGCGDGNQLSLMEYPRYTGIDVSRKAVELCRKKYKSDSTKTFYISDELPEEGFRADLSLSLDVIYHLIEDEAFLAYMTRLFEMARKNVIIYSTNYTTSKEEFGSYAHVRHRKFASHVESHFGDWRLIQRIENRYPFDPNTAEDTSDAEFFIYEKTDYS